MKQRFLDDVKDHKMTILKDDGVYRHVMFKKPNSGTFRFDLVTWPGYLAISGDMGDYIFSRLEDMFCFFETPDGKLGINCGYWCQKIKSISRFGSNDGKLAEYNGDGTFENVKEYLEDICDDAGDIKNVKDQLSEASTPEEAVGVMEDAGIEGSWELVDFHPTFHTEWILYAIRWGIMEYKKVKKDA